ncbi:MAG TPA: NAD-dependent epimerase/dehydratase family protein [Methylomirabilota bacterium]|jgi:UDP-glucose 4-epimerase|nr:NAD-dependent epimerase/dehydratase family protein [Methylomirabilota bacterium]
MTAALVWTVGRGGFLGSHLERMAPREIPGAVGWVPPMPRLPWAEPARLAQELGDAAHAFGEEVRRRRIPWMLFWCAGAGGVGTPPETLRLETDALRLLLRALSPLLAGSGPSAPPGLLFFSSSAGGVYGDSPDLPLTEHSRCLPISAYGRAKLGQERDVLRWAEDAGVSCLVARISNLYGPGQARPQGLIARLSQNLLHRSPLNVYVPLDTLRDYLHVDDAARYVLRCLDRLRRSDRPAALVKIFAAEQSVSIAGVLGIFARVAKRAPRIICVPQPVTRQQPGRLRFRSLLWTDRAPRMMDLAAGIQAVHQAHLALLQQGRLPPPPR